mgnify:CR=1 FL=1
MGFLIKRCLALILFTTVMPGAEIISAATSRTEMSIEQKQGSRRGGKTQKNKKTARKKSSGKTASNSKKNTGKSKNSKETSSDVRKRHEAAMRDIKLTQEQIKANDAAVRKGLNELGKLETEIGDSKKKVATAAAQVNALEKQIGGLQKNIADNEAKLEKLRKEYLKAVKNIRSKKKSNSNLAFIFSSGSFSQAMRRMRYLRQFAEWRDRQTGEIGKHVDALKKETQQLAQSKVMHDRALGTRLAAQRQLETQYSKQDMIVTDLKKNGSALKSHLAAKQKEANALNSRIAALIAEEQRKAEAERRAREDAERRREEQRQEQLAREEAARERAVNEEKSPEKETVIADNSSKKKAAEPARKRKEKPRKDNMAVEKQKKTEKQADRNVGKEQSKNYADARKRRPRGTNSGSTASPAPSGLQNRSQGAGGFEKMRGSLPRPVSGSFKVTSRFGRHSLPDLPDVMYDNPGIDAEVAAGAVAQAVYGGKVSGVYMIPGFSTVVIVSHGNYYTVYGNLSGASVKVGDIVKQGQGLGRIAAGEDDPGKGSIHFEVWRNREKLDPLGWIRS